MPTLTVTKSYQNAHTLNESDLDAIKSSLETFFNTTKIDADNIQDSGITGAKIAAATITADKLGSGVGFPPGFIGAYGGTVAPTGWLLCDGSAISRSTYSALFGNISTNYGVGDASTTFNVPDLLGRVIMGTGAGSGLTSRTVGTKVGAETLPAHTHSITDPNHSHALTNGDSLRSSSVVTTDFATAGGNFAGVKTATVDSASTGITATNSTGTGTHGVMQPSNVCTYIIKT